MRFSKFSPEPILMKIYIKLLNLVIFKKQTQVFFPVPVPTSKELIKFKNGILSTRPKNGLFNHMQIDKIRIIAIYLIGIGLLMTITWILLFLTHQVTDIETKPLEMLFLLLGEAITILLLILGGSGLLLRHK